jgi:hypothetical protein
MGLLGRLLQQLLLGAIILAAAASEPTNSRCIRTRGSLQIPYPFGTSESCCLDPSFLITCNNSTPFLSPSNLKVLNISLDSHELQVSTPITSERINATAGNYSNSNLDQVPIVLNFPLSDTKNRLTAVGCDTFGTINSTEAHMNYTIGCLSFCQSIDSVANGSCTGIGCCQTSIPKQMTSFIVVTGNVNDHKAVYNFNPCSFGFVVEEKAFNFSSLDLRNLQDRESVPVVLDYYVGNETCLDAQKNLTTYAFKSKHSYC